MKKKFDGEEFLGYLISLAFPIIGGIIVYIVMRGRKPKIAWKFLVVGFTGIIGLIILAILDISKIEVKS